MFALLTMKVQPMSMSRDVFWGLRVEEREKFNLEEQDSVKEKNLFRRERFQTQEDKPDSHQQNKNLNLKNDVSILALGMT